MTTIPQSTKGVQKEAEIPRFSLNFNQFVSDHITRSWWLTAWLLLLTYITIRYTLSQLAQYPITTIIVLILWAASVLYTIYGEITRKHNSITFWLKNNMYNSITNVEITLLLGLLILASIFGLYRYSVTLANFSNIPATEHRGAFVSQTGRNICFNLGHIDPGVSSIALLGVREKCFHEATFAENLSRDDITALTLGQEPATFCFDERPSIPDHGITCFSSVNNDPAFYEVSYRYAGANWGAVQANLTNLMVFRFNREELWRVWASLFLILGLAVPSLFIYRDSYTNSRVRQTLTYIWLSTPLLLLILLKGAPESSNASSLTGNIGFIVLGAVFWYANRYVLRTYPQEKGESELLRLGRIVIGIVSFVAISIGALSAIQLILTIFGLIPDGAGGQLFSSIDPDIDWGGFLLTLIITVFAIVVSFPLGIALALGRRSEIRGIPAWVTYPLALGFMVYALVTITPDQLDKARNSFETAVAYWPIAVPIIAVIFQRVWKGNVVAAFSTLYIEFIRGIPLITVLFLAIILFPIFLPEGVEILNVWRVLWGFTLFTAAYMAENVRGGLQAIPNGQYEAADSLGLSTVAKYRLIILPQALRIVIPAITNMYIGLFKDTTLVAIVGLFDILNVANAISAQPQWLGVRREAYLFIGILYYIICALISGFSGRLEKRVGLGER